MADILVDLFLKSVVSKRKQDQQRIVTWNNLEHCDYWTFYFQRTELFFILVFYTSLEALNNVLEPHNSSRPRP